ncbi:MAG: glycosyl transferase, partial [Candidatus Limnocylindrales bacterium]
MRRPPAPLGDLGDPIVAELFSVERLEQHARTLAAAQEVTSAPRQGRAIGPRIADNGRVLLAAYRTLAGAIKEERAITPAAEWLVDNFHIVDEQLREIRDDLPADYYDELPKLANGHLEGFPRVVGLAWAYVAHTDSRFDPDALRRMVAAYQEVEPLTLGELWAVAISLRIVLVENLRRLADQLIRSRDARLRADEIANSLLGIGRDSPEGAAASLRRLKDQQLPTAGRVQLFQRLRDQDPATTPALGWLEARLIESGTTAEETVRIEHQRQAAMNVSVRNVITSMRLISWFDWAAFVESVSLVGEVLRAETDFDRMDFATRDRYRHAVEALARASSRSELEVANQATTLAGEARDVGELLIGTARPELEASLGARLSLKARLRRAYAGAGTRAYVATIAFVTVALVLLALGLSQPIAASGAGLLLVAVLGIGPASDLAVALVNRFLTGALGPRTLPRFELADGPPEGMRTIVVVPTLLTNVADVEAQVNHLEIHYLANPEGDVRFALLSDWLDAPAETVEGDDELLVAATAAIEGLNAAHGDAPGGGARFLLFHRSRRWNETEGRWMGWERKRGKLHDLDALLRGSTATDILVTGRPATAPPPDVRYVITLDADTRLPRGAVARLVGTIAHPLNRPVFDEATGRVIRGYGILQPRITATLPSERDASPFQRTFSGAAGIDPYASAVSDVYQDLYGDGTYTGKGIYDLDAFERAMDGRVPENSLLSHDLFEGSFARAGLVTDIELFDEFPSNYLESAARQHRWARGDWQLLPWILGRARDGSGARERRRLPGIARWKMVDNLRRTLSAPLSLAVLVVAWCVPSVPIAPWTALVLAAIVVPAAIPVLGGLLPQRRGISKRTHLRAVASDVTLAAAHVFLGFAFLAHQAALMADAIGRTIGRLVVTHRGLLEWTTASQIKSSVTTTLGGFYRQMAAAPILAVVAFALALALKPAGWAVAATFAALWLGSPAIAWWVSRPPADVTARQLWPADAEALRLTARRTWRFFERFVGPEDNALPPDNFQEDPEPVVAHRTSPTNIGMYLLTVLTARDFGWLGTTDMVERLETTFQTIDRLPRFHGHLYNWYDTRDLRPLDPVYVSSVDSGNLCAAYLVVAAACRAIVDGPLRRETALRGIDDAVQLTRLAAASIADDRRTQTVSRRDMAAALDGIAGPLGDLDASPAGRAWSARLDDLAAHARTLADVAAALTAERGDPLDNPLVTWAEAAGESVASHRRDAAGLVIEDDEAVPLQLSRRLLAIADRAQRLFGETEFGFLFDPTRKLFSIGYRVMDGTLDPSYYDLLASEARLASFLAIAKGDVMPEHWFRLGRALTPVGRSSALISWSGSMFEYLM